MTALKALYWVSLFVILYSYIGYGLLVYLLVRSQNLLKKKKDPGPGAGTETFPDVTLVISAYNEQDFIEKKIQNTYELDYDPDRLHILIITDGSDDETPHMVSRHSRIRLLHEPERKGKVAAMNRAMKSVTTDLVIFSDANTLLNKEAVRKIVRHYVDPLVGGVAGEKKIITGSDARAAGVGEGIYWKYESFLKKMDSALYSVVGAAGELFSVRARLFEEVGDGVIIEDFVQSLRICQKGYRIRYEPEAYAMETSSATIREEEKRKIRISAGAFQAMIMLKDLFHVFRYPVLSFQFISHRVLRWTLCPLCLVVLFISNLVVAWQVGEPWYVFTLGLQGVFYLLAFVGWILANRNIRVKILYLPYYFLFMNISVFFGFFRFLKKKQSVMWEKAAREKLV
jgi:cellulose synthase/poly-beta-1,6-N-acetylglucosamine synthase-like glycosyltransferase